MTWKKLGVVLLAAVAVLSTAIAVMDHLPAERTTENFEVIDSGIEMTVSLYFPDGGINDSIKVLYNGEDITGHCHILIIDTHRASVIFDQYVETSKLQFII